MSQETMIGILGFVAIAACWALAVVLFRVSSQGTVARKLSILLAVEGFTLISAGYPEFILGVPESFYETHPDWLLILSLVHHGCDAAMLALYPPFLALALNTKLTRLFANKKAQAILAISAMSLALPVVFFPSPPVITVFYSTMMLLFVYALVVSIHAWRTAQEGLVRERAGIFAFAFGLRDIGWSLSYGIFAWLMWTQPELTEMPPLGWLGKIVYALGTLLAVPMIAYGVLRTQLFDIDLRIRWTIKQSTLAGLFVAIMFVISEGVSQYLSTELGNVAGLLVAAVVVFFLSPLQRFADGVASRAMPNTKNTPEYVAFRKMQVYEAAVSEAMVEGGISDKERSLLIRLRDSLGVSESDADAIELELRSGQPAAGI